MLFFPPRIFTSWADCAAVVSRPGGGLADERVVLASEVGVLDTLPDADVRHKGRLEPGKMFLVQRRGLLPRPGRRAVLR